MEKYVYAEKRSIYCMKSSAYAEKRSICTYDEKRSDEASVTCIISTYPYYCVERY